MFDKNAQSPEILKDHDNLEDKIWYGDDVLLARKLSDNLPLDQLSKISAYAVTLLENGSLVLDVDFQRIELSAPAFLLLSPNTLYKCEGNSPDCTGKVIAVSPSFADNIRAYMQTLFTSFSRKTRTSLSQTESDTFDGYFNLIYQLSCLPKCAVHDVLLKDVIQSLFNYLSLVFDQGQEDWDRSGKHYRDEEICHTFMLLVKQFANSEREVEAYAERMRISPKYLTAIVRRVTGWTAGEWIQREVVLQAKKLLSEGALTVQQVADRLHFRNQSHFGTYFKRVEGVSPRAWRNARI